MRTDSMQRGTRFVDLSIAGSTTMVTGVTNITTAATVMGTSTDTTDGVTNTAMAHTTRIIIRGRMRTIVTKGITTTRITIVTAKTTTASLLQGHRQRQGRRLRARPRMFCTGRVYLQARQRRVGKCGIVEKLSFIFI